MIDWTGDDLSPDKDGSIEKFQITQGKDYVTPHEGALVNSKYDCMAIEFSTRAAYFISKLILRFSTFNGNVQR